MLKLYQYIYGAQVFWGHVSTFPLPLSIMIGSQNQKQEILEKVAQGHPSYIYNYMDRYGPNKSRWLGNFVCMYTRRLHQVQPRPTSCGVGHS